MNSYHRLGLNYSLLFNKTDFLWRKDSKCALIVAPLFTNLIILRQKSPSDRSQLGLWIEALSRGLSRVQQTNTHPSTTPPILNLSSPKPVIITRLTVSLQGVLKPFCDLLAAKDDKTVCVVLDGLTNILATAEILEELVMVDLVDMVEEAGGLDRVEALQFHGNDAIYKTASQFLETFFPEEDPLVKIVPKAGENTAPQAWLTF